MNIELLMKAHVVGTKDDTRVERRRARDHRNDLVVEVLRYRGLNGR